MNNQNKQSNNSLKSATSFSLQVFIVGVILSVTFFLLLLASFKTYRSTITIIVNSKSEIASKNESEIIGNVLEIPKTLAFYDRLLKSNADVRDVTIGKSPDQRKSVWNEMIDIQQVGGNSSLINISITSNEENDANALVRKTSRTLFDSVSQYYDVKNDVDMRIIDGPISRPVFSYWYVALILSVLAGFSLALFFQSLLCDLKNLFVKHIELKNIFSNINNDKRTSAVESGLKDEQLIAKYPEDSTSKSSDV